MAGLGETLQALRELRGWSLEEFARQVGLTSGVVSDLEAGRAPSAAEQEVLEGRLGVSVGALIAGSVREADDVQPARVFLLHDPGRARLAAADLPLLRDHLRAARRWAAGGGAAGLSRRMVLRPTEAPGHGPRDAAWQGYRLAQEIRLLLGDPYAPLRDLGTIVAEQLGLVVGIAALTSARVRAAGVLDQARSSGAIVLGTRVSDPADQRFAIAHELCHLLFDPLSLAPSVQISLDTGSFADRATDLREARANGFAAELLLPTLGVGRHFGDVSIRSAADALPLVLEAQAHFGCPPRLVIEHLGNRGWYSNQIQKDLRDQFNQDKARFVVQLAPHHRSSFGALSELSANGGPSGAVAPATVWRAAAVAVAQHQEKQRLWIAETLAAAETLRRDGKPQRAGGVLLRAIVAAVERAEAGAAVQILDRLDPAEWPPTTLFVAVAGARLMRTHLDGAYERFLARTREHLLTLPEWSESRLDETLVLA